MNYPLITRTFFVLFQPGRLHVWHKAKFLELNSRYIFHNYTHVTRTKPTYSINRNRVSPTKTGVFFHHDSIIAFIYFVAHLPQQKYSLKYANHKEEKKTYKKWFDIWLELKEIFFTLETRNAHISVRSSRAKRTRRAKRGTICKYRGISFYGEKLKWNGIINAPLRHFASFVYSRSVHRRYVKPRRRVAFCMV